MSKTNLTNEQKEELDLFIDKLVAKRYELKISQRKLEETTGLTQASIDRFENKRNDITLGSLIRYTMGLGIDLKDAIK